MISGLQSFISEGQPVHNHLTQFPPETDPNLKESSREINLIKKNEQG